MQRVLDLLTQEPVVGTLRESGNQVPARKIGPDDECRQQNDPLRCKGGTAE
jgi:hypothetical protein